MSTTIIDGVGYQTNSVVSSNTSVPPDLYVQSVVNGVTITKINESVFKNNTNLIKITLPSTINNINGTGTAGANSVSGSNGETTEGFGTTGSSTYCHQFLGCSNLEYADLSETYISVLGAQCFANCFKLKDIYLPETLTEIHHYCFYSSGNNAIISLGKSNITIFKNINWFHNTNFNTIISRRESNDLYYKYDEQLDSIPNIQTAFKGINDSGATISDWTELPSLSTFTMSSTNLSSGNATINMTFSNSEITETDISNNFNVEPASAGTISSISNTTRTNDWTAIFTPDYGQSLSDCSLNFNYKHYGIDQTINFDIISIPSLTNFTITPTDITVENHGTINMTFSDDIITLTDISNSLTVDPSNAGIITNITGSGTDWSANFVPNYGLDLTDCSLKFKHDGYGIDTSSNTFNIDTTFKILDFSLTPSNLVNADVSAILRIEFSNPLGGTPNFNFTLDPSYIATLGQMSDVSSGFIWEGVLTRTPNMNKLDNKLDFDFSYNGVEVSANLVYDVIENSDIIDKKWSLSNSDIVNKGFTNTLQMSPNGLLMGFIDGSNVEIYRKSDTSYTWNHNVSYNGNTFSLTNNHIVLANNEYLQIYDYSGTSWSIMNGGNITYSNIVALSINLDGTYVAVSNNTNVKVLQNISDNWTHINSYNNGTVIGLTLSPNGLKLGMGIGTVGQDFSSIMVEDVVNNDPPVITLVGDAVVNHEVNTTYNDAGATAFDIIDGDITGSIIISNNVDTTILGTYTITYDVSNSNNISAIQKRRIVNIVDTTNPVVTLTGPSTIELEIGDTYTEQGATASDNSNESLTVVIGGDVVDTSTEGSYTVTYSATDSTGNTHQIGRLVTVVQPAPSPVFSNPSTDIFQLLNFQTNIDAQQKSTLIQWTLTGQSETWKNGDYEYRETTCKPFLPSGNLFSGTTDRYQTANQSTKFYSHLFNEDIRGETGKFPYDTVISNNNYAFTDGNYHTFTKQVTGGTATFPANYYHTSMDNSTILKGEFISWKFPFTLKPTKFSMDNTWDVDGLFSPVELYLIGSNDGNVYTHITGAFSMEHLTYKEVIINLVEENYGYKYYKLVCTKVPAEIRVFWLMNINIYGDVYIL